MPKLEASATIRSPTPRILAPNPGAPVIGNSSGAGIPLSAGLFDTPLG
ncbi:MAG: hypothetical protein WAS54_06620 [Scrofimicrobium sp.]